MTTGKMIKDTFGLTWIPRWLTRDKAKPTTYWVWNYKPYTDSDVWLPSDRSKMIKVKLRRLNATWQQIKKILGRVLKPGEIVRVY